MQFCFYVTFVVQDFRQEMGRKVKMKVSEQKCVPNIVCRWIKVNQFKVVVNTEASKDESQKNTTHFISKCANVYVRRRTQGFESALCLVVSESIYICEICVELDMDFT